MDVAPAHFGIRGSDLLFALARGEERKSCGREGKGGGGVIAEVSAGV